MVRYGQQFDGNGGRPNLEFRDHREFPGDGVSNEPDLPGANGGHNERAADGDADQ